MVPISVFNPRLCMPGTCPIHACRDAGDTHWSPRPRCGLLPPHLCMSVHMLLLTSASMMVRLSSSLMTSMERVSSTGLSLAAAEVATADVNTVRSFMCGQGADESRR